jgi:hypothetical protein
MQSRGSEGIRGSPPAKFIRSYIGMSLRIYKQHEINTNELNNFYEMKRVTLYKRRNYY